MDRRVRLLLKALKDGGWHGKILQKAVTVGVVEAAVHLRLIEVKRIGIRGTRNSRGFYRITGHGRAALSAGWYPSREDVSEAIRLVM
ncbi:MAG TPA: hypothetical protein VI794_00885 [Patescibacteria group bacterium]|nr:hypothetical protein [Patescibacteria group bacterium]